MVEIILMKLTRTVRKARGQLMISAKDLLLLD